MHDNIKSYHTLITMNPKVRNLFNKRCHGKMQFHVTMATNFVTNTCTGTYRASLWSVSYEHFLGQSYMKLWNFSPNLILTIFS